MTPPTLSTSPTDADLLRAYVRSREHPAFGRLAARHGRALRQLAWRHVRDGHAAEEVAQAALIVLARRPNAALRSAKRRGDSVRPWLAKVAGYAASEHRRAEGRRRRREQIAARPEAVHDAPGSAELGEVVTAALASLPRRQRRLLTLRHIENRPWSEVAERLHTTPDAARKAASRAMADLRRALEARGVNAAPAVVAAGLALPSTSTAAPVLAAKVITMLKIQTTAVATTAAAILVTAGLLTSQVVADDPPLPTRSATASAADPSVDASSLAQAVLDSDGWLNDVETFAVAYEQTRAQLDEPADYAAAPAVWQRGNAFDRAVVESGFDQARIYHRETADNDDAGERSFAIAFDGKDGASLTVEADDNGEPARQIILYPKEQASRAGSYWQGVMPFGRIGSFAPWWAEPSWREAKRRAAAEVEEATYVGRETFRGRETFAVDMLGGVTRYYVGVDDGRVYGVAEKQVPPEQTDELLTRFLRIAQDAGADVETTEEANEWMFFDAEDAEDAEDAAAREAAATAFFKEMAAMGEFKFVQWLDDYAEVAPGRFVPMTQGMEAPTRDFPPDAGPQGKLNGFTRTELRLTSVRVDEPLDDAMFAIEADGPVEVRDARNGGSASGHHRRWPEVDAAPADDARDEARP